MKKNCPTCNSPLQKNRLGFFFCPECIIRYSERAVNPSKLEQTIVEKFPYLIAAPFHKLLWETNIEAASKYICDVFSNVLKYLALILETEYLRSDCVDENLNQLILSELNHPLISSWDKFIKHAVISLEKKRHVFFIPQIKRFYEKVELSIKEEDKFILEKGYYNDDGDFVKIKGKLGWISALLSFRNQIAHGRLPLKEEGDETMTKYYNLLLTLLEKMTWTIKYNLLKYENGNFYSLMGYKERPFQNLTINKEKLKTNLFISNPNETSFLSLIPFFIIPSEYIAESSPKIPVLIYDKNSGAKILYISPLGHTKEITATFKIWWELIEAKKNKWPVIARMHDNSYRELSNRCNTVTKKTIEKLIASHKIFDGLYYKRADAESHLREWLKTIYPLLILKAVAGGGKTYLMKNMADEWLANGETVLYLHGAMISKDIDDFMLLIYQLLCIDKSLTPLEIINAITAEKKFFIIILDAINEQKHFTQLFRSLMKLCDFAENNHYFKVLISIRTDRLHEIEALEHECAFFYHVEDKYLVKQDCKNYLPSVVLHPLSVFDIDAMWHLYEEKDRKRFYPAFSFKDLQLNSRAMIKTLNNPLILRLFLELYSGKSIPKYLSKYDMLSKYFDKISAKTNDNGQFLLNFARICIEKQASVLYVDDLFNDARTAQEIRRTDIKSPYLRLIQQGILAELFKSDGSRQVSFVLDVFFEHVLGRTLLDDNEMMSLSLSKNSWLPMYGALESALVFKTKDNGVSILFNTLEAADDEKVCKTAGYVFARLIIERDNHSGLAKELIKNLSEKKITAIIATVDFLNNELFFDYAVNLILTLLPYVKTSLKTDHIAAQYYQLVAQAYLSQEQYSTALIYYEKAKNIWGWLGEKFWVHVAWMNNCMGVAKAYQGEFQQGLQKCRAALRILKQQDRNNGPEAGTIHNNMGMIYFECNKLEKALASCRDALRIQMVIYGQEHPELAWTYNNIGMIYTKAGRYAEALKVHQKALRIDQKFYGEYHPDLGWDLNCLGVVYHYLEDYNNAIDCFRKALNLWERGFKKESPDEIYICKNISISFSCIGDRKNSEKYFQKANELSERISNILFSQTGSTLGEMPIASRYQKKMQEIMML